MRPDIGATIRYARDGINIGRITYYPDWDAAMPWCGYINGEAVRHFATVEAADAYFARRGFTRAQGDR